MSGGTVNISRDIFDHGLFRAEPFTEREAWVWMIMEARWKAGKVRVGNFVVALARGDMSASVRFMAQAWGWTAAKVQRYLERLKKQEMVSVKTDTGVNVITICNYDKFQTIQEPADTGPIQDRYRTDTKEKKDEIKVEEKREGKPSLALAPKPKRFSEFWAVYPHRGGAKQKRQPAEVKYEKLIRAGVDEQEIIDGAKRAKNDRKVRDGYARDPTTWLNQAGWKDEIDVSRENANGNGTSSSNRPGPHNALMAGFAMAANSKPG